MKKAILSKKLLGILLIAGLSFASVVVHAQSPADDPGIGGPGSPGNGPSGDGSPIVPFDGGMSLMLAASGISYAYKKVKGIDAIKAISF